MLRSDLHIHTLMSGHAFSTLEECIGAACRRGLSLMAITDHGPSMEGSAHEGYFEMSARIPKQADGMNVLFGCEMNILNESGDVDLGARAMSGLDILLAGLHARTPYDGAGEAGNTAAVINAMKRHPNISIITHPFRAEFPISVRDVVQAAKECHVILEINLPLLLKATDNKGDGNSGLIVDRTAEMVSCTHSAGGRYIISSDAHYSGEIGIEDSQYRKLMGELGILPEYMLNDKIEELKRFIPSIAFDGDMG